jgi:hypothetical protein
MSAVSDVGVSKNARVAQCLGVSQHMVVDDRAEEVADDGTCRPSNQRTEPTVPFGDRPPDDPSRH